MSNRYLTPPDSDVPVTRLRYDCATGQYVVCPESRLFIRGPIPLDWLAAAAALPGKTLNVAMALWWHEGMAKGATLKLTRKALSLLNVERDAAGQGLNRLEEAGLIRVERKAGCRPVIVILVGGANAGAVR